MKNYLKLLFTLFTVLTFNMINAQTESASTDTLTTGAVEIVSSRADSKSPVSQKTLNKEDIQKEFFGQDPNYLLSKTPSVTFYSDGGNFNGYTYMRMRGVEKQNSTMVTSAMQGVFLEKAEAKAELMQLIKR